MEMPNLKQCILIKLCALIFEHICERTTKFHEKILLDSRVINLQKPTTKYLRFPVQRCLLQSLVRKWRCVVRTRSTFSRSVMVSIAVSSLGHTDLFFIDHCTLYSTILSKCFASSTASTSHSRPSGDFFTFLQDNAPAHRARETV